MLVRLVHQFHAHHQVVIEELRRVLEIRADAADVRGQVDHQDPRRIDPLQGVRVHPPDLVGLHKVVVFDSWDEDVRGLPLPQLGRDEAAQEARAARDNDALASPEILCHPFLLLHDELGVAISLIQRIAYQARLQREQQISNAVVHIQGGFKPKFTLDLGKRDA